MALYYSLLSSELTNRCCGINTRSASGVQARQEQFIAIAVREKAEQQALSSPSILA